MQSNPIDSITDNLVRIFPLLHRALLRTDFSTTNKNLSRPHFVIMNVLNELGPVPVSTVGKRLIIAKPQMTRLIDRLIDLNIVQRQPDSNDRRVINIKLTEKGLVILEQCRTRVRDNIKNKLSCLNEEDLEVLLISLNKLKDILLKLE